MDNYKIINVHLFRPACKGVKQRCEVISCNATDKCELYKNKKCIMKRGFWGGANVYCPHGRFIITEGYTNRARSFYSWEAKRCREYDGYIDVLTICDEKLAVVGDYVYLPYPHLKNYVNKIDGIISDHFLPISEFGAEKINEIYNFKPLALLGGEITSFQEKYIPQFLQHLNEVLPNLYHEFLETYPEYKSDIEAKVKNYIGRTATVSTLKNGSVIYDHHSNGWVIDNNQLVCDKSSTWLPFGKTPTKVVIDITEDMVYKVSDNKMVCEATVFVD